MVSRNEMPPSGMPQPAPDERRAFVSWLSDALDRAAAEHPNPGRPAIHRLNRAEYSNAVRDLLALDIQPGSLLPSDDSGYGFDNIGDVLSISPSLLERYLSVARTVSRQAVGDASIKASLEDYRRPRGLTRTQRVSEDQPFDSRGGMLVRHRFPVDGVYLLRVQMRSGDAGAGRSYELRIPVKAGIRTIAAAYEADSAKSEAVRPGASGQPEIAHLDLRLDGARLKLFDVTPDGSQAIDHLSIGGPYSISGPGDTPSRRRIFVCQPARASEEAPCARTILSTLARRAYRRPVTDADLEPLLAFYRDGRKTGGFENGIETALRAILVSPDFLLRIERDPPNAAPATAYRISDLELASRLSFFLWSSIPDDELLDLAAAGQLHQPAILEQQVRRMLADPKSAALVQNFAGQWLYLRNLAQVQPDPGAFPQFDAGLREAFEKETELFCTSILREDRSVLDLLDANYTFVNERLANFYGIPSVRGTRFRRVTLTDPTRGGILGQGSLLTVTSYPNRTSVVQRGKWILANLLGEPPLPPPPNVPQLKPQDDSGKPLTMRQQMEQHRANPACASCHVRMDPLGFALENYNGIGKWRTLDAGSPIDASGRLPDGAAFVGLPGLKQLLLGRRDQFVATLTSKLLTYALGRGLESYDQPAIREILRQAAPDDRFSALILGIVKSTPFEMRRSRE